MAGCSKLLATDTAVKLGRLDLNTCTTAGLFTLEFANCSSVRFCSCAVNKALYLSLYAGETAMDVVSVAMVKVLQHALWPHFAPRTAYHRCKKTVLRFFYFGHVFYVFNVFFNFPNVFLLKNVGKVHSGKQINKKHFQNNSNEIDL